MNVKSVCSMKVASIAALVAAVGLTCFLVATAHAQASGLTRAMVGKADVSVPGREAVVARITVAPGGASGRHTHPGDEISYVLEGETMLLIDGQPPRKVSAGESFVVPAGVVHDARNETTSAAQLVGVYVVEKGKPLATPAAP